MEFDVVLSRTLARVAWVVRRRLPLLLLGSLLAALIALSLSFVLPPRYVASVQVLMLASAGQLSEPADLIAAQALARNYASLVKTDAVLREAADLLHLGWNTDQLRQRITVSSRESFYLTISASADRAQTAADMANTIAERFLQRVQDAEAQVQGPALENIREEIAASNRQLKLLDDRIAALQRLEENPAKDPVTALVESSNRNQTLAELLKARQEEQDRVNKANGELRLMLAKQRQTAVLWHPAAPPDHTEASFDPLLAFPAAFIVLILGMVLALLRDWSRVPVLPNGDVVEDAPATDGAGFRADPATQTRSRVPGR